MSNKITYRQQYTRCGKQRCRKCKEGDGHGPYWYAYWSENGRTMSKYIGIQPPIHIEALKQATAENLLVEKASATTRKTQPKAVQEKTVFRSQRETQVLRIYLLGQFRVERKVDSEWLEVDNRTWRRRRARALLGCLLNSPSHRLGREQVMEALWPDLDTDTAGNRLNGAVHELRQILEPGLARPAASRMLRLERDVLELADRSFIWVDAEAFENLINEANTLPRAEEAERLLEEAEALYGGDYLLEELYSEWATRRREAIRRTHSSLLFRLSELREQRGAYASAIEPLDRLLAADAVNESAVRRLMVLLTRLDRRGEALRAYQRLVVALKHDYETEPLPETRELHEALRLGHLRPSATATSSQAAQDARREVIFPRPVFQRGRHNQSPLVGRNRELDTMRQLMHAITNSTEIADNRTTSDTHTHAHTRTHPHTRTHIPRFLLLTGEAGIGKTRLAEELSLEVSAHGWAVTWSQSYEQESTIPYRPWMELLRALLQDVPPEHVLASLKQHIAGFEETSTAKIERLYALLPELATREGLSQLRSSLSLPPEQERLHLWEVTLGLLSAISQKMPLLLVLDDLHWTDDSSIDLLAYLARHLQDQRVLLVGTYRDAEPTANAKLRALITDLRREQAITPLLVQPLTSTQIGSLLAHLPQAVVQNIQTQAGGNPFFAEELARCSIPNLAASRSQLTGAMPGSGEGTQEVREYQRLTADAVRQGSVPETIASVLERRLSNLSAECQSLLGRAAILGGSFELHHLLSMTSEHNEDTLLDLLEEALHAGLLAEEGNGTVITYHFWHPLIVSHLYERLSAARRAQLHRRAAAMLEQFYSQQGHEGDGAAAIIYHLSRGGGNPAHIARYAELAGNQAYAVAAYSEAKQYYQQAIQTMSADLRSTSDTLHLARLQERVCECCMVLGNYVEARQLYERILKLRDGAQESSDEEIQIQALIWREIGRTWSSVGEYILAHECFERGRRVLSSAGITTGPAWACLLIQRGTTCRLQGSYEEARSYVYEALEILEPTLKDRKRPATDSFLTRTEQAILGDPLEVGRAHELLGIIAASVGQLPEALKHLYTALAIFELHDLVIAMAKVCGNLGAVYTMKAENTQARVYMRRSLELTERMGDLPNMAFVTGNLGEMASRCGDLQEAEEWFKRSLALAEQINDREHMSWCSVALGAVRQDQGRFRESAQNLRRALAIGRAMKNSRCIGSALVAMADLRINVAIAAGADSFSPLSPSQQQPGKASLQSEHIAAADSSSPLAAGQRLILRARSTLQHALTLEGLEVELITEGRLLLATTYFLLGELETAQEQTLQTMQEAQEHEITRILARAHRLLGRIMAIQEKQSQANYCFEQAMAIFRENEMRLDYARTVYDYGFTLLQRGHIDETAFQQGVAYLQEAREIFSACRAAVNLDLLSSCTVQHAKINL